MGYDFLPPPPVRPGMSRADLRHEHEKFLLAQRIGEAEDRVMKWFGMFVCAMICVGILLLLLLCKKEGVEAP